MSAEQIAREPDPAFVPLESDLRRRIEAALPADLLAEFDAALDQMALDHAGAFVTGWEKGAEAERAALTTHAAEARRAGREEGLEAAARQLDDEGRRAMPGWWQAERASLAKTIRALASSPAPAPTGKPSGWQAGDRVIMDFGRERGVIERIGERYLIRFDRTGEAAWNPPENFSANGLSTPIEQEAISAVERLAARKGVAATPPPASAGGATP